VVFSVILLSLQQAGLNYTTYLPSSKGHKQQVKGLANKPFLPSSKGGL